MHSAQLNIKKLSWAGFLISIGIVYGDIGTSPLYTFKAIIKQTSINKCLDFRKRKRYFLDIIL